MITYMFIDIWPVKLGEILHDLKCQTSGTLVHDTNLKDITMKIQINSENIIVSSTSKFQLYRYESYPLLNICAEYSPAQFKAEISEAPRNAQAGIYIQVTTMTLWDDIENTRVSYTAEI